MMCDRFFMSFQITIGIEPNKIVEQKNQILITVESRKSTSVYVKYTGTTSTSTFLQGLFLQYLHKTVITILSLQPSLPMSVHDNILRHLYKDIYTVVHLLSCLLASLVGFQDPVILQSLIYFIYIPHIAYYPEFVPPLVANPFVLVNAYLVLSSVTYQLLQYLISYLSYLSRRL